MTTDTHGLEGDELEVFVKQPLGGVDRRAIVPMLAEHGARVAREDLAAQRAKLRSRAPAIAKDACVLLLGGSNGILRQVAVQLLFAEGVPVHAVHYDSAKLQIGPHHAQAITDAAREAGVDAAFRNEDATKPDVVAAVVAELVGKYRVVHLVNGIAAGATKRYAEHGPTQVKDLDVAFDPVLQVPDFTRPENVRRVGLVDVEVATDTDIERTNRFMGSSSLLWAEPLARAGFIVKGESVVAFCDYDFPPDDPVYAMGPLAGAKVLQRKTMGEIKDRFGARTARICYPPVATTALGAIPGGLLMYALSTQVLKERGQFRDVMELGRDSMALFAPGWDGGELHLDDAYKAALPEFNARKDHLGNADIPGAFGRLYASATP